MRRYIKQIKMRNDQMAEDARAEMTNEQLAMKYQCSVPNVKICLQGVRKEKREEVYEQIKENIQGGIGRAEAMKKYHISPKTFYKLLVQLDNENE